MYLVAEAGPRLKVERERVRLTVEQAAVLSDVSPKQWAELEAGRLCMHVDFVLALGEFGFDPRFIGIGERKSLIFDERFIAPKKTKRDASVDTQSASQPDGLSAREPLGYSPAPQDFAAAIELMRRSIAAVDAFVGEGAAAKSPDLVAALMSATIQCENRSGVMDIVEAIGSASGSVSESIDNFTEVFGVVMDEVVGALMPRDED